LIALLAEAAAGSGAVAVVSGPAGIGKTRLAAELARDALRRRMAVLYTGAGDATADALTVIGRADETNRPALLVLDDADHVRPEVITRAAELGGNAPSRRLLLLVLCERAQPPDPLAGQVTRSVELDPLEEAAVAEIARLYQPAGVEPLSTRELAMESRGVPLTVHRLAAEWARAGASHAAGESARRAAAERHELRAAESELSSDLLALDSVDEQARLYGSEDDAAPLPTVCPFLGLATFDSSHAEYFFGRERLVAELVARLVGSPLLAVVGPSGSGKSSAVRAGLLPALASGVLPGSDEWPQAVMRPGPNPVAAFERVVPERGGRAVLAVDQFEEVFTVCRDEGERVHFLDALVTLAEDRDAGVQVVLAMRADFYGRCGAYDRLARLVGANHVLVGPMRRDELRRAIIEPARRVGLRVERSLADALIADVLDEPGGLPLLSAALLEQWRERDGRVMRRAAYERTGGVRGAVGRLAEATYERLSDPERRAARRILLRLADAGDEGASFVRRPVPLEELDPDRDGETAAALESLVDSRLVTVDEGTVEVAHEALLREWPRLRSWLEEDAEGRRLHQHLAHAARGWDADGRDPGELYRGARLASALEWSASHEGRLNALEREFLDASRAGAEHEAEHERATNRRLRVLLAGLAGLLVLAVVAGVVALNQRGEARDAALSADAQRVGAEALTQDRFDQALRLARASVALDDTPTTQGNLLTLLQRAPAALAVLDYGRPLYAAALSPDGRLLAIGGAAGNATIYRTRTRAPVGRTYRLGETIQSMRFSPDGKTLAIGAMDPAEGTQGAVVDLIDAQSQRLRVRVELPLVRERAPFAVAEPLFLPDSGDMVVAVIHGDFPDAPASWLYRVDSETGAIERQLRVGDHSSLRPSLTADGKRLFATSVRDNRSWEIDPQELRIRRTYPVGDFAGAVSPDGQLLALGSETGHVRMLDLGSGAVRSLSGRHDGSVLRLAFTPDGSRLITSGADGQAIEWDVESGSIAERYNGHSGQIWGFDLQADGSTLVTSATDGRAIVWDLAGNRRLDRRFTLRRYGESSDIWYVVDVTRGVAVSPDGRTLAVTHRNGTVELLDTATLRRQRAFRAIPGFASSAAFSPDGRVLAVTGAGGRVTLWSPRTGTSAGELRGLRADSQALAFSPDGSLLAAAEALFDPPRMRIWDVRRGRRTSFAATSPASALAFSHDGELLAAAAGREGIEIWDPDNSELAKFVDTAEPARAVAFSPDGSLLVAGFNDGTVQFFSTDGWRRVGRPFEAHAGVVVSTVFSPDGRMLATTGDDGTVALWDVETRKAIGTPVTVEPDTHVTAAFSPTGSHLFAVSTGSRGLRLDTSPESWKRRACLVAGRDLTAQEWDDALPGQPYRAVCAS
jgi:WD40 repeat protein